MKLSMTAENNSLIFYVNEKGEAECFVYTNDIIEDEEDD